MLKNNRPNLIIITSNSHNYKTPTYNPVGLWSNRDLCAMREESWQCRARGTRRRVFHHCGTGTTHKHIAHCTDSCHNQAFIRFWRPRSWMISQNETCIHINTNDYASSSYACQFIFLHRFTSLIIHNSPLSHFILKPTLIHKSFPT